MSKITKAGGDDTGFDKPLYVPIKRRSFFMYAGATAGATALLLSGCDDDEVFADPTPPTPTPGTTVSVGSGDVGVLNYAYALEQLEAAFYTQLRTGSYYTGLNATSAERQILDDLYYHEVIHREFFKAAITGAAPTAIIKDLTPNFSAINFNDRASVLGAAKAFEDLGVSAYNGAGRFISTTGNGPLYLLLAGKIVSVEARHAAIIRDLLQEGNFVGTDVINSSGLEISKTPTEVVAAANTFLAEGSKLNVSGLV
ncbi:MULTISPECIES: ferritin-like domain-containing protein [Hymenobacter]|uniref:ferritin-like domain-containing protein n=1 Tax=Hymenobacter TaxID=89966 RepID=UPI001058594C|nr:MULTISPECIES: ferritin-like domain-containing protein [Hymenobacter]QIL75863.1 ferritin-like domain-containing protein [Hymenobacter sp. HDW8]